jgi:N-acetyl-anhydromuramyl-L-alanine amidase AmpD
VRIAPLATMMAALVGCQAGNPGSADEGELVGHGSGAQPETIPEGASLDQIFEHAGALHDVPVPLLKAIAWSETRGMMVKGEIEFEGVEPAFGIMALRGAALEEAASLAGLDVELVKTDAAANVTAAAALLSQLGDELDVVRSDLGSWAPAVATLSGIELEAGQIGWVRNEVYSVLHDGVIVEGMTLDPQDVAPDITPYAAPSPGPDYAASVWHASPNFSSRPSGSNGVPQMVIIHSCEGAYSGCWSWLASSQSGVSAHYVVNSTGSEISQLVRESKKAWHISATYDCGKNGGTSCNLNGQGSNNFTIGIEHAGFANQSSWAPGLLDQSSKLVCDITTDNNIPRDSFHIVAHGKLQPWNRIDPGPNWPWSQYIGMVGTACNQAPEEPPPDEPSDGATIIVDSNQGANADNAKVEVSANWGSSTATPGYYNTGYWYRSTGSTSDLARFKAYLPAGKKMKVEAWWPAASNRSPNAPFIVYDASDNHLDTVYVNQQQNGSQWVELGTYDFTTGWNTVALSRWTDSGYNVVADAVRFTEVP